MILSHIFRLMEISEEYPRAIIIDPDDPISSYTLMMHCELIISFGSTIGIEALYLEKPSILISRSFYEDLGGCIRPKSHGELIQLLITYAESKNLPEVDPGKEAVYKYGYYMKFKGESFLYAREYSYKRILMIKQDKEYPIRANIFVSTMAYLILGMRIVFKSFYQIPARMDLTGRTRSLFRNNKHL